MSGPILPEEMRGRPFTVSELRDAGLPLSRLRHGSLHLPTRSVRCTEEPTTLVERAAAFARALPPDVVFSHATAALLLGIPMPERFEQSVFLDVMRESGRTPIRRKLCAGHRGTESRGVTVVGGLRVIALVDTWLDLGDLVSDGLAVDDLVVAGDVVAQRLELQGFAEASGGPEAVSLPAGAGVSLLTDGLEARVAPRGKAALTEALSLVRSGSRSPMETRARLMFHRAGFPEPELNAVVRDAHGGWLLEGDFVWRRQRVVGEYQGSDHGSIKRRSADSSRLSGAEDEGYRVLEIYAEDVYRGSRRRACLTRFARSLGIDPAELRIE